MGCAIFTLVGTLVLYANKSNAWALRATFGIAAFFLFWACFLAWRDEEKEVEMLHAKLQAMTATASVPPIQNIYLPAPHVAPKPEPLKHNVQCLGVEVSPDFPLILMCFRNVEVPGKPMGSFKAARLKVAFYLESSGKEVEEIFPARWLGFPDQDEIEIGVRKQCAVIAMHFSTGWVARSTVGIPAEIGWKYEIENTFLPNDRLKIVANLFGENNLSLDGPITGILTLSEDGTASFSATR
jgi:hypothetical protein